MVLLVCCKPLLCHILGLRLSAKLNLYWLLADWNGIGRKGFTLIVPAMIMFIFAMHC
jgi:hypothetical protein